MAKELPYFEFEPGQWENGNIQACSRDDKGLFMDLCSLYWQRLGDVSLKLACQKLCGGNATAFDSLIESQIFRVIDGNIFIEFLSEQLEKFENTSKKNSENALNGWKKRRELKALSEMNATASNSQYQSDAIKEDKIKEDKIIKKDTIVSSKKTIEERKEIFKESLKPFVDEYGSEMMNDFYNYWIELTTTGNRMRFEKETTWEVSKRLLRWYKNNFGKQTPIQKPNSQNVVLPSHKAYVPDR